MDRAIVAFSRQASSIRARDIGSRENARKRWPLLDPSPPHVLVTYVSAVFDEDGRLKRHSHFRKRKADAEKSIADVITEQAEARGRWAGESPEHSRAKALIADELRSRISRGEPLYWSFRDDDASDFALKGDLLLGATQVVAEHRMEPLFGFQFRLDLAVIGPPIKDKPWVAGGIEIERTHEFDGYKALMGRSLGFPLITVDISEMSLAELTPIWAHEALSATTRHDPKGLRKTYVFLHDLAYPQYLVIPNGLLHEARHKYIIFAADAALDQLDKHLRTLREVMGYTATEVVVQKLNAKSDTARTALENAGAIVGSDWHEVNAGRCLFVTAPRPIDIADRRGHQFHATLAKLMLRNDCLVGYQYELGLHNTDQEEDLWCVYSRESRQGIHCVHRFAPKRLADPLSRYLTFVSRLPGSVT